MQWCVRQYTETENMATAIERVLSFTELEPEAELDVDKKSDLQMDVVTNKNIANFGVMEFRNVKLK